MIYSLLYETGHGNVRGAGAMGLSYQSRPRPFIMQECPNSKRAGSSFVTLPKMWMNWQSKVQQIVGIPSIMHLLGNEIVTKANLWDRIGRNLRNCKLNISIVFEALVVMFSRILPLGHVHFLFFLYLSLIYVVLPPTTGSILSVHCYTLYIYCLEW